ncbi:MAG: hypothetical protein JSU94_00080 [Phycisphaerales bacterium]|nr:MAG: hypothetical protein JSW47_13800 [Phycisphaerales bacterium]UCG48182.1 MAG: hypothetical protein JSU94_00080 [Phycisphaerales bacterium]
MALWLMRAGRHGEFEQKFLEENRVYLTWENLNRDLSKVTSPNNLRQLLKETYPDNSEKKNIIHSSQIWKFSHQMNPGDWVILPSKKSAIHVAEIASGYRYDSTAEDPYYHWREVNWIVTDVPRSNFRQDLLYSFGASMTICSLTRNDAEKRVRDMAKTNWKSPPGPDPIIRRRRTGGDMEPEVADLEELAQDQIAKLIVMRFKGHGLARRSLRISYG